MIGLNLPRRAVDPPPSELQFLWLSTLFKGVLEELKNLLIVSPGIGPAMTGETWEKWVDLFKQLDPVYGKDDHYLECKQSVASTHRKLDIVQAVLYQRLVLNPLHKDEWMMRYVCVIHEQLQLDSLNKEHLVSQVKHLLQLFPGDYDLLRFSILFDQAEASWLELMNRYAPYISEPLAAVLKLRVAIDHGWKLARCRKILPSASMLHRDPEADWRLIAVLSQPELKFPIGELEALIEKLAPDDLSKHAIYSKIFDYYQITVPFTVLKKWKPNKFGPFGWASHYHLALHYAKQLNFRELREMLLLLEHELMSGQPEYLRVELSLDFLSPLLFP